VWTRIKVWKAHSALSHSILSHTPDKNLVAIQHCSTQLHSNFFHCTSLHFTLLHLSLPLQIVLLFVSLLFTSCHFPSLLHTSLYLTSLYLTSVNITLLLFSSHLDDRLGRLKITRAGLSKRNRMVYTAARRAGARVVVTMGGGYDFLLFFSTVDDLTVPSTNNFICHSLSYTLHLHGIFIKQITVPSCFALRSLTLLS
jgi:hypothetical protein